MLAPGASITAGGQTLAGTSMAAPHVAGAAAVLAAHRPAASAQKIHTSLALSGPEVFDLRNGQIRHRLDLLDAVAEVERRDAMVADAGCRASSLARNDDGSTGLVNLPFAINLYGTVANSLYVNNNGNVTFGAPLGTYTPFTINAVTPPIIAPFFADVDTRGPQSSLVTYGATTFAGRSAFCVDWDGVGYYAGRDDKLNRFELLLVDRSDAGVGDFDIVFNYNTLVWETGSASGGTDGFGGTSAGAGFSAGDGNPAHFFEFPGSRVHRGLLDDNTTTGLANGSRGTLQRGRYTFPIRNGASPGAASIGGTVSRSGGGGVSGAPVQACPTSAGRCVVTRSNTAGGYQIVGLAPGEWRVTASSPAGTSLLPATAVVTLATAEARPLDLVLQGPVGPPPGTAITDRGTNADGIPSVYWTDPLQLTTTACAGGSASYQVTQGATVLRSGAMTEGPPGSGRYAATVPALRPATGAALVTIRVDCPGPNDQTIAFNIYIDPSGVVVDQAGSAIAGATVTLLRSDSDSGPFETVPSGSEIMSPGNRVNPMSTDDQGRFGWDVIAGFYIVRASAVGCVSPLDGQPSVETGVLTIPPPALNLVLTLRCGPTTPPVCIAPPAPGAGAIVARPGTVTIGTEGPDVIYGTEGADRIAALGGDDVIFGMGGDDQITGGDGDDTICGGEGRDVLAGGAGDDTLSGDLGPDDLSGGDGRDRLFGGSGGDRLSGGEGTDACSPGDDPGDTVATCE